MSFAPVYLVQRGFFRIYEFFRHWYADGSRFLGHAFISSLERLDRFFAVRITLRYFFEPLYKDYTIVGRILGVIFRSVRILLGVLIYLAASAIFVVVYILWLALPLAVLTHALTIFF